MHQKCLCVGFVPLLSLEQGKPCAENLLLLLALHSFPLLKKIQVLIVHMRWMQSREIIALFSLLIQKVSYLQCVRCAVKNTEKAEASAWGLGERQNSSPGTQQPLQG